MVKTRRLNHAPELWKVESSVMSEKQTMFCCVRRSCRSPSSEAMPEQVVKWKWCCWASRFSVMSWRR